MANYDSVDLDWTWDGDYTLGSDGDVGDTTRDLLLSFRNELHTVIKSEFNDWQEQPNLGCNTSDFVGEANTRETAVGLRERLISRIVAASVVQPEDIDVRIIPTGRHQMMGIITVQATATTGNSLTIGEPVVVNFLYDSMESGLFFLETSQLARDFSKF